MRSDPFTPLTHQPHKRLSAARQDLVIATERLQSAQRWAAKEGGLDISAEVDEALSAIGRAQLKVSARRAEVNHG